MLCWLFNMGIKKQNGDRIMSKKDYKQKQIKNLKSVEKPKNNIKRVFEIIAKGHVF